MKKCKQNVMSIICRMTFYTSKYISIESGKLSTTLCLRGSFIFIQTMNLMTLNDLMLK